MIDKVIDVSMDDGVIDWKKVKAWGCNGAILKCTNALDFIDREYENNVQGCLSEGTPFGSYMVIHPWEPVTDQFDCFFQVVDKRSSVSAVDWELKRSENSYKASLAVLVGLSYMNTVHGRKPWLYLNLDYLIHRLQYARRVMNLCDVWYSNPSPKELNAYPAGFKAPVAHQYTFKAKVPGIPGACDVNRLYRDHL
jgi:GH25 family lysozyme M1 (1,4-beta-N-acetylmuramidase)